MADRAVPGFALGVVKDGELVYARGFGVTNVEKGQPVTSRTIFQLAETSMMPTAIAVLQLVDRGKLDLNAPVTDYLPYFRMKDERYRNMTVAHLLANRSGLRDLGDSYGNAMADWGNFKPQYDAGATERWVRTLSDEGLLFAPGTSFGASDLGYSLLGDVIAKASGQSYEDYVRDNILAPLGMDASTFLLEKVDRGLLASPHTTGTAGKAVASETLPYHRPFASANNLFSNVEDMAKLAQASMNGGILKGKRILPEDAAKQMWTAHSATTFGDYPFGKVYPSRLMQHWGYGWYIGEVSGHTAYTTGGNEYGYSSAIIVVPDETLAVVAMSNAPLASGVYGTDIAADVMGMLLTPAAAQATPSPTPIAAAPDTPAATNPQPPREGLLPDAPEFAKHGPFWVGYKSLVIGQGSDRPLEAGIWYPALNPTGTKEEITYSMTLKIPVGKINAPIVVYGHALRDAEVDASAAPYPLVIFSHGFAGNAAWYNTLLEHFASHGFIVLAPEHVDKWDPESSERWQAFIDRPRDIKRTLDYAAQVAAPGGDMAGQIDTQHVAVVGHSLGGYTALAMGGAQYDLAAFNARCAQLPPGDLNTSLCTPLVPNEENMAVRAGLDPMPEGLWPSFGDPRVTAIIPIAGASYLFDKAGLSKITVPVMAIGGSADTLTPYDWGSKPSYDNASSAKKALVTLVGAEHMVADTACKNMPWTKETNFYSWFCFDPAWDKEQAQDLINHFSTAFLLDTLKGDAAAAAALAPKNVTFPGIKYETTAGW